jgi:hypothetical protein
MFFLGYIDEMPPPPKKGGKSKVKYGHFVFLGVGRSKKSSKIVFHPS